MKNKPRKFRGLEYSLNKGDFHRAWVESKSQPWATVGVRANLILIDLLEMAECFGGVTARHYHEELEVILPNHYKAVEAGAYTKDYILIKLN